MVVIHGEVEVKMLSQVLKLLKQLVIPGLFSLYKLEYTPPHREHECISYLQMRISDLIY